MKITKEKAHSPRIELRSVTCVTHLKKWIMIHIGSIISGIKTIINYSLNKVKNKNKFNINYITSINAYIQQRFVICMVNLIIV